MFSIGEFSLITRLSVKTLRYYHEQEILVPDYIDTDSGYRFYRKDSVDRAAVISALRDMDFPIAEIKQMLTEYKDDADAVRFLEMQRGRLEDKIQHYRNAADACDVMITTIRRTQMNTNNNTFDIVEKNVDDMFFAGIRFKGKYSEVGKPFGTVARAAGRFIAGHALCLFYDGEYKESNADIEAGFPLTKMLKAGTADCRILKGGHAVTLVHKGAYENLGSSYEKLFAYIESKKLHAVFPSREVYVKGPGMLFKGNSEKFLTEIQVFVD